MKKALNKKTRIMLFGTFDVLHKGHLNFFQQARNLAKNPYLIVSIARDVNVKKIKNKSPHNSESARLKAVKNLGVAEKVMLGALKNYLLHIIRAQPEIIALGYDQVNYTENLEENLLRLGLKVKIIKLKPYLSHKFKSSILKKKMVLLE